MLNEKISNPLNIMPEDFYNDKLRPVLYDILANVTFDPILLRTVEETINKADGSSINKDYDKLEEDLMPLSTAILGKNYMKTDDFIRADENEKSLVKKLATDIQDLLTIIKCTEKAPKKDNTLKTKRYGYDDSRKENIVTEDNSNFSAQRKRLPNF